MRRPWVLLLATSLAAFTATLDNTVTAVALRDMQSSLGSSVLGLQGIITAYTVALAALLLAGGALVDVLGAARVLRLGTAVFGVTSVLCATAGSVGVLVGWRAVQGAGAALLLPGGLAVLAAAYPDPVRRRRAVAVWAAVGGAALVAGPVVGGELVARHGWPAVFWVNVPLCLLVLLLTARAPSRAPSARAPARARDHQWIAGETRGRVAQQLPDDHGGAWGGLDVAGAGLSCVALGAAAYGVVLLGRHGLSWRPVPALAVAAVTAVLLARVERRTPAPLLPAQLLRDRRFRGATLAAFAAALAVFVLMVFVSLFLQLVLDHDARHTGTVLLALPAALVVTAAATSHWRAVVAPVLVGLVVAAVGLLGLAVVLHPTVGDRPVVVWLAVTGAGVGLTTAPVVATTLAVAGERRSGLASASVTVARELGGVVAVAGLGALAVARLTARLTELLGSLGVPAAKQPAMLDALLRADRATVRSQLVEAVGLDRALGAYQTFQSAATASFASSTRWVLAAAGVALLVLAGPSARLLSGDGREGVEEG